MPRDPDNTLVEVEGQYRGCPLIAGQSAARIAVVKADIDRAHNLDDVSALLEFADSVANAPEARAYAYSKLVALHEVATDERRRRPGGFDRDLMQSQARLMYSRRWQHPIYHCSLLDPGRPPSWSGLGQPVRREVPLDWDDRNN
jgi:hypothetical protein